jgi:hypothetical protein
MDTSFHFFIVKYILIILNFESLRNCFFLVSGLTVWKTGTGLPHDHILVASVQVIGGFVDLSAIYLIYQRFRHFIGDSAF